MAEPTALILRTAGTNCDLELAHAFERAGARAAIVHLNRLVAQPQMLQRHDLIGVPGGFSYGDDIAAGRIFANRLRQGLGDALRAAIARGTPILGICNGFQVLVKTGLLPDPGANRQTVTLADNVSGRFVDRWVGLRADPASVCVWTRGLDRFDLPIAHGEGRFVPESEAALRTWEAAGQIPIRYAAADNPNGSVGDVAAVCDPTGLVLGLMPHPERCIEAVQHPAWSSAGGPDGVPAGLQMIRNAVAHVGRSPSPATCGASGPSGQNRS